MAAKLSIKVLRRSR